MSYWFAKHDIYKECRENGWVNPFEAYYMNNKRFGYDMRYVNFLTLQTVTFKNLQPSRGSFKVMKIENLVEGQEIPGKKPDFNWRDHKVLCASFELSWTDSKGIERSVIDAEGEFPMLDKDVDVWSVYGGIPAKMQIYRFYLDFFYLQFPLLEMTAMDDDQRQMVKDNTHVMRGSDVHYKLSTHLRKQVLDRDGHQCQICGSKGDDVKLDIDHIYPRSLGGDNRVENLQVLCKSCNCSKGPRTLWDYLFDYDIEVTPRLQQHIDRVRELGFTRN